MQRLPELPSAAWIGLSAALSLACLALCPCLRGRASARAWLALPAAALAGFAWSGGWASDRLSDALPHAWERRDIEVVGVIAELVQRTERGSRFAFDVEQIVTEGAVVPDRVLLSWYVNRPGRRTSASAEEDPVEAVASRMPAAGERWRLVVRLRRPHASVNPHGFDAEAWLLERNLRATGYVRRGLQRLEPLV
ncbi:MAG: DUF4131 domain-containing protein, partial [Rhodocyclaceae bacterium]|nr:DUF4131 domain-containing protein [Rhodocyclaceae bacterium]